MSAAADEKETGRIEAFSDGVFAIAVTLLVLELKVPHRTNGGASGSLGRALAARARGDDAAAATRAMALIDHEMTRTLLAAAMIVDESFSGEPPGSRRCSSMATEAAAGPLGGARRAMRYVLLISAVAATGGFLFGRHGGRQGSVGMTLTLGTMAWLFARAPLDPNGAPVLAGAAGTAALVAANLYVFAFGFSWGPVVWVLLGEMFNNRIRGAALALPASAQWVANWLVTLTFPGLSRAGLGWAYGLYTAAVVSPRRPVRERNEGTGAGGHVKGSNSKSEIRNPKPGGFFPDPCFEFRISCFEFSVR